MISEWDFCTIYCESKIIILLKHNLAVYNEKIC